MYLSISSEVQPEFREYERLSTTVLNAYLQPVMDRYLGEFAEGVAKAAPKAALGINQSSGGLMSVARARHMPIRTALSGPAAGAVGAIHMARLSGMPDVISLDMGGTSADVALIRNYTAGTTFNKWIEGYPARIASLDINAVGAGGGSIAWFDRDGLMKVGPQSAGAQPGPACYGRGGTEATVTDANLVLGRLSPNGLLGGGMALDEALARKAIAPLAERLGFSVERTAHGMLGIVVANMVRAIRAVSVERGHDPRDFALLPFGGAGPLHATDVAKSLGIRRSPGAVRAGHPMRAGADRVGPARDIRADGRHAADRCAHGGRAARIEELKAQANAWFAAERVDKASRSIDVVLDARYVGQNFELAIGLGSADPLPDAGRHQAALLRRARARLWLPQSGRPDRDRELPPDRGRPVAPASRASGRAAQIRQGRACVAPEGLVRSRRRGHAGLRSRDADAGRHDRGSGRDRAARRHHAPFPGRPRRGRSLSQSHCGHCRMSIDPITLEIISNGLKSIADETYIALMKSAYSTNIKERHDHSTAIIDPRGRLIVQAENSLAIHLGSMMGLMNTLLAKVPLSDVREGDIFLSNDPFVAGGTHLPDVNMAMPVFADGKLVCFMCDIAHHADIGGITPGSMAGGTEIYQEGTRIPLIRLFRQGELQEDILDLLLLNARVPEERRGDYFAQVAACRLGVRRIGEMIEARGVPLLVAAFDDIIRRTGDRLREALTRIAPGEYTFEDVMDDDGVGTTNIPIKLRITVPPHGSNRKVLFDFAGTGPQVKGNINATMSATSAGVLYSLKALLDPDVPNNQGLIDLVDITRRSARCSTRNSRRPSRRAPTRRSASSMW